MGKVCVRAIVGSVRLDFSSCLSGLRTVANHMSPTYELWFSVQLVRKSKINCRDMPKFDSMELFWGHS